MPLSMYSASAPAFVQALNALSQILDKTANHCAAKKIDPAVLMEARLFPDMLPFVRQVFLACDFAKNCVARLAGGNNPKFSDEERTIEALRERIARVVEFLGRFKPEDIDGTEEKEITFPAGGTRTMTMQGQAYLVSFALPNFYFHATTAYDILRHNGVELGKRDFLGWR